MASDTSEGDYRSRRRKYEDDGEASSSRKRRHRDDDDGDDADKPRRRERSRSRSRDRKRRERSRTPDPSTRRGSRERRRDRDSEGARDKPRPSHRHRHRHRSRDRDSDRNSEPPRENRRHTSRSPERPSRRHRDRHLSPSAKEAIDYPSARQASDSRRERHHRDSPSAKSVVKRSGPLPSQDADFAVSTGLEPEPEKEKPNFAPTGALAAAANAVTVGATGETVTLKYHEPPEARKPPPRDKWKLFVFKGADLLDTVDLSPRSCWLVGRDRAVVDLPAEHPSVSKQHAALQFRHVERRNEFGDRVGKVKPYLIDLESANGTVLNGDRVPDSRYLELRDKDVLKFGLSEREYVVMLDRE